MPQGLSIHIGLNSVDPKQYGGWDGQLVACEFDARDMETLARGRGFQTQTLFTQDATAAAVTDAIGSAGEALEAGDILLLTYSGHGGQVPDANGDEDDRMDETWVLYDRQLIDDELYTLWSAFEAGTRIMLLSDSCHSGTVAKLMPSVIQPQAIEQVLDGAPRTKALPPEVAAADYRARKQLYDEIQASTTAYDDAKLPASALLISGCQDNQTSADGQHNGLFTQTLLSVWDGGGFRGSYKQFAKAIVRAMPLWQTPNYFTAGGANPDFEAQEPFTI